MQNDSMNIILILWCNKLPNFMNVTTAIANKSQGNTQSD